MKPITIITALTAVLIQTMPADAITYPSLFYARRHIRAQHIIRMEHAEHVTAVD